jgi:hypothetical protein
MFQVPAFADRLLARADVAGAARPFITVAIPHYKHRRYLEAVLESLFAQAYEEFEIVVSDDRSPDDSNAVIPAVLAASGRSFRYYAQPENLGYDGNVRFCLSAAEGRYVLLLGNDDALAGPDTLATIAAQLQELGLPEVAFTSFEDWATGAVVQRARGTCLLGAGTEAAIKYFRTFSFVSGLIYDRAAAARHETDRWDKSVYYQIYLACRIMAAGGRLGALALSAVRKDVRLDGQTVPNYATRAAAARWSFQPRHTGLDSVIRVAADAVLPLLPAAGRSRAQRELVAQIFMITYPFWLFEYRRAANWSYAVGIARGMWPRGLLAEHRLNAPDYVYLWLLYLSVTFVGLTFPASLFERVRDRLSNLVRRRQQMPAAVASH